VIKVVAKLPLFMLVAEAQATGQGSIVSLVRRLCGLRFGIDTLTEFNNSATPLSKNVINKYLRR
jgi:hypothetical protein